MKNINLYIIIALVALIALSCNDDLSKYAEIRYPELIILEDEEPPESAIHLEEFIYEPQFVTIEGEDTIPLEESQYDDYRYEWRINLEAGRYDTVSTVIGTEHLLSAKLDMIEPANEYWIVLRMTHKEVGFIQTFDFQVDVLSPLGQGLLVAHTEDGGLTSDINLLMTKAYNASFEETDDDIIYRNVVSAANGRGFDGLVSKISFQNSSKNKRLTALVEGEAMHAVNGISFIFDDQQNTDLFFFPPEVYNPQWVSNYYASYGYVINNGAVHVQASSSGAKYSYVDESSYKYEINSGFVNRWSSLSYFGGPFIGHDVKGNQFIVVSTTGVAKECTAPTEDDDWAFNPRELPEDLEFVAGGIRTTSKALMLMKSKTTNESFIYRLVTSSSKIITGDYIFDMSNCPDLDRATAFQFSQKYDEFYYAVDNKLYVAILNVEAPSATVVYSLPAGENISHLRIHLKVSGMTTWSEEENDEGEMVPDWESSPYKVMSVASYNGTEGFIRTLPIQYGGAGGIADEKYVHTYDGFGKITDLELRY